jgi:hypothetical protein
LQWRIRFARSPVGEALQQLAPLVYDQLRRSARRAFAGEANNTLQPTALVNAVFLKLVNTDVP